MPEWILNQVCTYEWHVIHFDIIKSAIAVEREIKKIKFKK